MNRAIILDRDGTLVCDPGYVHKVEDFKFLPNVVEALKLLTNKFKLFIITNQSGIGRGYYTKKDFHKFNNKLTEELKKENIIIEKTYYCLHEPEEKCDCRKPRVKFIKQAEEKFNIDLKNSFVIGDHPHDIELGKNANCKTIYLLTGHGKKHKQEIAQKPDFIASNLLEAAQWIIK